MRLPTFVSFQIGARKLRVLVDLFTSLKKTMLGGYAQSLKKTILGVLTQERLRR